MELTDSYYRISSQTFEEDETWINLAKVIILFITTGIVHHIVNRPVRRYILIRHVPANLHEYDRRADFTAIRRREQRARGRRHNINSYFKNKTKDMD